MSNKKENGNERQKQRKDLVINDHTYPDIFKNSQTGSVGVLTNALHQIRVS
jgi:hypothetical protein